MIPLQPENNKSSIRPLDDIVKQMPLSWLPPPTTIGTLTDVAQQMSPSGSVSSLSFNGEWQNSRYLPWRFSYLDYQHFQQLLTKDQSTPQFTEETISFEYNKVLTSYYFKQATVNINM